MHVDYVAISISLKYSMNQNNVVTCGGSSPKACFPLTAELFFVSKSLVHPTGTAQEKMKYAVHATFRYD